MKVNMSSNIEKFANIAEALGVDNDGYSHEELAEHGINAVIQLSKDIGIISRMRELNIPESAIQPMAEAAMKVTRLLNNNPRTLTIEDIKMIYENAY